MNRAPEALREAGAERVWIDHDGSARAERADLFAQALRPGDVLVLLSRGDLGRGREIPHFEALAAAAGATVEVAQPPAPPEKLRPGPPPTFAPDHSQERRIRHYWHGPFKAAEALRIAEEVMGHPVGRATLNRHLGPRSKPRPWINQSPAPGDIKER